MIEKTPEDEAAEPATRSKEEVARALGGLPASARGAGSEEMLREHGPLRLDKSGALAGRPKLEPVRALRKDAEAEAAPAQPKPRKAAGGGARRASLPPKLSTLRPERFETPAEVEAAEADAAAHEDAAVRQVEIPAGSFLYGENKKSRELPAFKIDKHPVTNEAYAAFVAAAGHRTPAYWVDGRFAPELADHPVVGVDYFDALAYAQWVGKDLPFEDEWERAARGTDGRVYPWGNDQDLSGANTARVGLKMTVPVDLHAGNLSPDGVQDMVGNAWEITHSPAPGGGVVVRGGSWYDFALYAKTYFRFATKPDACNGTIGFRCVERAAPRDGDAPGARREVPLERVGAAIDERRGPCERVAPSEWSVERRDLIVDLPRLRTHTAEVRAEDLIAPKRGIAVALHAPETPAREERVVVPTPPEPDPEAATAQADDRVHVGEQPAPPTLRPPGVLPDPGPATGEASAPPPEPVAEPAPRERAATTETSSRSAPPAASTVPGMTGTDRTRIPPYLWILLTAGLLLVGGLVAVLVNQEEKPQQQPLPIEPPTVAMRPPVAPQTDLPEPPPYEAFPGANELARIVDVTEPDQADSIGEGTWLLVFADLASPEGKQTLQAAHGIHRRLAAKGVHVGVVLVRDPYMDDDGSLEEHEVLAERLKADSQSWLWDGITVLLDPAGEDGRTSLHRRYCREDDVVAAVLLHNGRREGRTVPPEGGLHLESLVRIGRSALKLATK